MKLITWNVQWCCGVDGKVDPARIVTEAKRQADFDVLCLQEIGDNYPHPRLAGSAGEDQFALLASLPHRATRRPLWSHTCSQVVRHCLSSTVASQASSALLQRFSRKRGLAID